MKTVRVLLLVVLAMLLPLRGALAEVAHCVGMPDTTPAVAAATASGSTSVSEAEPVHHDHGHDNHTSTAEPELGMSADGAAGATGAAAAHDHLAGSVDKCHLCTASCASTPFMSTPPTLAEPMPVAAARYPSLTAPVPSHPSEGQERPPRSL